MMECSGLSDGREARRVRFLLMLMKPYRTTDDNIEFTLERIFRDSSTIHRLDHLFLCRATRSVERFQLCVCHLSSSHFWFSLWLERPAALRTTFCSSNARLVLTPRRDASIPSCNRRRLRSTSTSLVCVATPWRKVRLLHLLASLYYYTGKVRRIRWRRSHCMVSFYRLDLSVGSLFGFGNRTWMLNRYINTIKK